MNSEAARHELYASLEDAIGPGPTSTLMSLLPPVGWDDVATKDDLVLSSAELRQEMAALRSELREEMAELREEMAELREEMAELRSELRGEMAQLRGDLLTEVSAVRADLSDAMRRQTLGLVVTMVTIGGLSAAAAGLL